jgi:hypothetical protein
MTMELRPDTQKALRALVATLGEDELHALRLTLRAGENRLTDRGHKALSTENATRYYRMADLIASLAREADTQSDARS